MSRGLGGTCSLNRGKTDSVEKGKKKRKKKIDF